ncbi:thiol-disulfide oxidoreductase DCC family protein [Sphingomonas sp.]|uniref:thiol-disulfide oxidoreductase DCC family protein n=1 Tax=Sphingomonas sp. TaxID=28214 RepID=UPI003CC6511D
MTPYSYRDDPAVPAFDDSDALYVFDGECVLCSRGAAWLMRHDPAGRIRFTSARGTLGQALYGHYGLPLDETYLLLDRGRLYTRTDGFLQVARLFGGWWRAGLAGSVVPRAVRDAAYAVLARNRLRWFGRSDHCALLTPDQRARLVEPQ